LIRLGHDDELGGFEDHSVDLLHLQGPSTYEALRDHLDRWLPKLSEAGIVLVQGTNHPRKTFSIGRFFDELSGQYPTFEFLHDHGMGFIAAGGATPERIKPLFEASRLASLRDEIRRTYASLGQAVLDRLLRDDLQQHFQRSSSQVPVVGSEGPDQRATLDDDVLPQEDRLGPRQESQYLRIENSTLREKLRRLEQGHRDLVEEIDNYQRSAGWALIQKARNLRLRLFREGRLSGKCWNAFAGFVRVAAASGMRAAMRKAYTKIERKLNLGRRPRNPGASFRVVQLASTREQDAGFEMLSWNFTGDRARRHQGKPGHFKILLVSHAACRTGAPLCLLRLAEELSKHPDLECWIVLQQGGELASEFARVAPTLEIGQLVKQGHSRTDAPRFIARAFHAHTSRGVAVCNTMAVSEFHAAFADCEIPVLSWIHELPTMVDLFGGSLAVERVKAASRQIMVPADAVLRAWIEQFGVDPSCIRKVYYGQAARTSGLNRELMRSRVLKELGLPEDARIVLGCGTVDLRKGADLFAQVARRVLTDPLAGELAAKTWFVWVGHSSIEHIRHWLQHDAALHGLEDRLILTGPRADTVPYFLAADLFALTSREDPCPIVNMEAMESGLAVVAFQDAGGAPEVLGEAGIAVPYLDVAAMAKEVMNLLADPRKRQDMGRLGQAFVREKLTWARFMSQFLEILKESYGHHAPRTLDVSVVVPSYRHSQYLEERLKSIFKQTRLPREIIFLDDASPDNSVEVARRLAQESPIPMRIIVNEQNSGSTFRQWLKGLELASGDLIWIAESDDSCHAEFLERLVPEFYDPEVVLAYCQSALIGPEGERLAADFLDHTSDISPTRWRARYCVSGVDEAELALSQKNTIPNASAVLFRRPEELDFAGELGQLQFTGDHLFYAMLIRTGKIAYIPDILNHYRRHEHTVSNRAIRGDTHVEESLDVKARLFETFPVSPRAIATSLRQSVYEYHWLKEHFGLERPPLGCHEKAAPALDRIRRIMRERLAPRSDVKILLVVQDMKLCAETLACVHLGNALAKEHTVFLCNARPWECDPEMISQINDRVVFLEGSPGQISSSFSSTDASADRSDPVDERRARIIEELIQIHKIDVIHSCSGSSDRLVHNINEQLRLPWFSLLSEADCKTLDSKGLAINWPAMDDLTTRAGVSHDPERESGLPENLPVPGARRLIRSHGGYDPVALPQAASPLRKRKGDVLFCLIPGNVAARRVKELAIAAVQSINRLPASDRGNRTARLVLASDPQSDTTWGNDGLSPKFLVSLAEDLDLFAAMGQCDAVLVPQVVTTVDSSSLVVAALAHGLPVIAADDGAVPEIITHSGRVAGALLPLDSRSRVDVDQLASALLPYLTEPEIHESHRATARSIFQARYHIDVIAAACLEAYTEALDPLTPQRVKEQAEASRSQLHPFLSRQSA